MDAGTLSIALSIVLGALIALLSWVFVDARKTINKELDEIKRKHELLEAKFYEFENEKYNKIMELLSGIRADIAVIKNEIDNLKGK